jgi:uncharacterized membrane protein (UPF0182 family)
MGARLSYGFGMFLVGIVGWVIVIYGFDRVAGGVRQNTNNRFVAVQTASLWGISCLLGLLVLFLPMYDRIQNPLYVWSGAPTLEVAALGVGFGIVIAVVLSCCKYIYLRIRGGLPEPSRPSDTAVES